MDLPAELHPAILQTAITVGLGALSWVLHRRYRKPYYAWWTIAWALYSARLGAIMEFLVSDDWHWLYWHQVLTGWVALALLRSAMVFVDRPGDRRLWVLVATFPPAWSYLAIYRFDSFLAAALPAVVFLALASVATAVVFLAYWRRVRAPGALLLGQAFLLWGLHHLDYPFLRARGAWVPWGYYLDILFTLAVGAGMVFLAVDDLQGRLLARGEELQRLSNRMVAQHEDERRRISLELHDETAQVFAAVTMRLGLIRERADAAIAPDVDRVIGLVEEGMRSVRRVAHDLRPALLDDLGFGPALRALASTTAERGEVEIIASIDDPLPPVAPEAEAVLYRAMQELLSNAVRHANAARVDVRLAGADGRVTLVVEDDGRGMPAHDLETLARLGHAGLAGVRERVGLLGGTLTMDRSARGGTRAVVQVPLDPVAAV